MNWMVAKTHPSFGLFDGICSHATVVNECKVYVYGGIRK